MYHWELVLAPSSEATPEDLSAAGFEHTFDSQPEAEAWLGEYWSDLQDYGVAEVSLIDGENLVYGPMSLEQT
ncbi:MAG: hypothetical protein ACRDAX_03725 [Propionibacteriaceae bacterium]